MSNEAPIVVAPRPVRLSHAFFHIQRDADDGIKLAFNVPDSRTSPRSALPSEALEEFLSILTPNFMRKPRSLAFPTFIQDQQQRALGYRSQASPSPTAAPTLQLLQDQLSSSTPPCDDPHSALNTPPRPAVLDTEPRWPFARSASALLSSPVSRLHTRNPFYLHHDSARFPSPIPSPAPLTPATVPLPMPSPDELIERLDCM